MSLLDRLNLLIRSELNDISRGSSFKSAMSEIESSLRDARRQRAELRRSEANLIKQIRDAREKSNRWEDRAMLALKHGDEELAREALVMKNRSLDSATRLRDELDDYRAQIRDIEKALEALEMKLEGARGRIEGSQTGSSSRRSSADVRNESAWDREMRRRMRDSDHSPSSSTGGSSTSRSAGDHLDPLSDMVDEFGTSKSFSEFDRMSSKINEMEAGIEAIRELSDDDPLIDPRRRELEDIFSSMERRKRTDDGLRNLKEKADDDPDDLADLKKKFE